MTDRYCVFGNPVAHSKSPRIHAAFARQTGQDIDYAAHLAPLDGFAPAVRAFAAAGGCGANVTVPFKAQAYALCSARSARAQAAGAVNTLAFAPGHIVGDNTDGAGLVADLRRNLGCALRDARVLLLGAGGAARGVLLPLLECAPARLHLANRTPERATTLCLEFGAAAAHAGLDAQTLSASGLEDLQGGFDLVINATAASLAGAALVLPAGCYAPGALAYDMMYGQGDTPFLVAARAAGAAHCADGLGMLVEQAAEAFALWRGVRPDTAPVLAALRAP